MRLRRSTRLGALAIACMMLLAGCGFSVYELPLPGGADTGDKAYHVTVEFRDVVDLVPHSAVKVDDLTVGKVTDIGLDGWNARVTLELKRNVDLPDNVRARIRQTSLLGEKFVSLSPPKKGAQGRLGDGDVIPLARTGRNPEVEELLGVLSLLLNGGGLQKVSTITDELNKTLDGREPQIRELLDNAGSLMAELDDNKQEILTAIERVNRLAKATNRQKKAITDALDELPEAVRVLNNQRDDLVKLLDSLKRLSDVGTETINKSKQHVIRDLKMLEPVLDRLADAGDAVPRSLSLLLTYPFPDTLVGTTPAEARDAHIGDYSNLSVRLEVGPQQVKNLLGAVTGDGPSVPSLNPEALKGLEGLLKGENDGEQGPQNDQRKPEKGQQQPEPTQSPKTPSTPDTPQLPELPELVNPCSLVGLFCRPAPGAAQAGDAARLDSDLLEQDAAVMLLAPVMAQ